MDKISTQPRRLVFDSDAFYWLVHGLAAGLEGVDIDRIPTKRLGEVPRWRHEGRDFIFYLDPSSFWRYWQDIAIAALKENVTPQRIFVCPRTPELDLIPKPTWHAVGPKVQDARASRLCLLLLDRQQLVRLYAAQELYQDATQGDIDWTPDEVAPFLRTELADFWQSILTWKGDRVAFEPAPKAKPKPDPTIHNDLVQIITGVVGSKKFLSLDELLIQLPGNPDRGIVLGLCGEISQIKVHTTPNMTILQWQGAK